MIAFVVVITVAEVAAIPSFANLSAGLCSFTLPLFQIANGSITLPGKGKKTDAIRKPSCRSFSELRLACLIGDGWNPELRNPERSKSRRYEIPNDLFPNDEIPKVNFLIKDSQGRRGLGSLYFKNYMHGNRFR
ncbi:hypothetical protein M514_00766 [Trichuris suis]|uniref:Transthyretin-like family protein n=1 Tax=Trichuris suis TaxID=68888 RepID=A0A085N9E1_9BILA|nr:hypothetical protein M514_00766 [Trichuris suis]